MQFILDARIKQEKKIYKRISLKKGWHNFSIKQAWKAQRNKNGVQTWKSKFWANAEKNFKAKVALRNVSKSIPFCSPLKNLSEKNIIYCTEWRDFIHRVSTVVVVVVRTSTKLKWSRWKWAALCSSSVRRQQKQTSSSLYVVLWNHRIVWFT